MGDDINLGTERRVENHVRCNKGIKETIAVNVRDGDSIVTL